jgi:L-asparaginase
MTQKTSILIIYTGGTIGMIHDSDTGVLKPFRFDNILEEVPELAKFGYSISSYAFEPPVDSSNIGPGHWIKIADIISSNYSVFDGFIILHGTDTMAYSASALSFMLEGLTKPVIFTGSQLPIGYPRTDGKENLISSIEIAAAKKNNEAVIPEVCIFFENKLLRGNRTTKYNVEEFNAFRSENYPPLAEMGVKIKYNYPAILSSRSKNRGLTVHRNLNTEVAVLKIFPGIKQSIVKSVLSAKGLKAIVLETFGAGNAPDDNWMIEEINGAVKNGLVVVNVTQCKAGSVEMSYYESGLWLSKAGVISGYDITIEAMVTKLMFLLGLTLNDDEIKSALRTSLRGEITM